MYKLRDAIYGFAIGDALGVPYEFKKRDTFQCSDMVGFGTWNQPKGTWSDDTSMTLATLDSLKIYESKIDYDDLLYVFRDWLYYSTYTANNEVFDVGMTTRGAIRRYASGVPALECGATDYHENGNGSLMRILPLAFIDCADDEIRKVSGLTHAHEISKDICVEYVHIARKLIEGKSLRDAIGKKYNHYKRLKRQKVKSTGFVVDTFEAALWSLVHSDSYKGCVLLAVNLGGDTDTVAAIAGGLAGIIYGYDSIPKEWIESLRNKELIDSCIDWGNSNEY